ncbi:hypothetical protein NPIL_23601 [Nephila pilipes]|uniref:Uncharacterized protein n=1 Tax=Nephila pilipes TaxID=299642 RepID=A0A8X6UF48_NEPPI|nr:hypothetical protein NPIL_23601 [Nephila pilipes]
MKDSQKGDCCMCILMFSASGDHTNASASVYSRIFSFNRAFGKHCTNFDGEMDAVHMALTEIAGREEQNIVIFIDSQATIRAFT